MEMAPEYMSKLLLNIEFGLPEYAMEVKGEGGGQCGQQLGQLLYYLLFAMPRVPW